MPSKEGHSQVCNAPHVSCPCSNPTCPKNHIYFYKDKEGPKAVLNVVHHKFGKHKGPKQIPLAPPLFRLFGLLEQASKALFTKVRFMGRVVCMLWGTRDGVGPHALSVTPPFPPCVEEHAKHNVLPSAREWRG